MEPWPPSSLTLESHCSCLLLGLGSPEVELARDTQYCKPDLNPLEGPLL